MSLAKTEPELAEILYQVPAIQVLQSICQEKSLDFYLVGGAIRDVLLKGTLSQDLDFTVPKGNARFLAQTLAQRLEGKWICLDDTFQIYRVILFPHNDIVDIADFIGDDVDDDLHRRDLTINAMAFDFTRKRLLDPFGGQRDLTQQVIRMISADNMLDDPLRLLRVFRFGAELGFSHVDGTTLNLVRAEGEHLIRSAPERIHYELMKLLSAPSCSVQIQQMADIHLLEHIFPELSASRPIPGNRYHHLPLYQHTLELIKQAEVHYPDFPPSLKLALEEYFNPFTKRLAVSRLACLMHDVGKPATMSYDPEEDRYRFYGHDEVGAEISWCIGHRMRWGKKITDAVVQLVRWHLYPASLLEPQVTDKAKRRFFNRLNNVMPEMILLAMADRFSALGPAITEDYLHSYKVGLIQLWTEYEAFISAREKKQKLLTGSQVMELLHLEPGPQVGEILRALQEAQLNGEVNSSEAAIDWLRANYSQ